ncbi:MAG: hypothetical protein WCF24_12050 [Acidimicrobiales bacterium]
MLNDKREDNSDEAQRVTPLFLVASIGVGAGAASVGAAPVGGAAIHRSMAPVMKMGKLAKIDSKTTFTLDVGHIITS